MILTLLALIDLVLVGSLIVMVMFSGYENFVSRLEVGEQPTSSVGWGSSTPAPSSSRSPLDRRDLVDHLLRAS